MTLDDVEDIEQLRKAAKLLDAEVQTLSKLVIKLKRELHELKHGRPEQLKLELQIAELEEQLARRNKLLFGEKSEKTKRDKSDSADKPKQVGHNRSWKLSSKSISLMWKTRAAICVVGA